MAKNVIVTVRKGRFCRDMELPSDLRLEELRQMLLETLKNADPGVFGRFGSVILLHEGNALLDDDATLRDYGILTGFFLDVAEEEA